MHEWIYEVASKSPSFAPIKQVNVFFHFVFSFLEFLDVVTVLIFIFNYILALSCSSFGLYQAVFELWVKLC